MTGARERLAAVACDAWWEQCALPERWPTVSEAKRQTFREMVEAAMAAARAARGRPDGEVEQLVAEAMCGAFMTGADAPGWMRWRYDWRRLQPPYRELFVIVARHVIAAGRAMRATSDAARAA